MLNEILCVRKIFTNDGKKFKRNFFLFFVNHHMFLCLAIVHYSKNETEKPPLAGHTNLNVIHILRNSFTMWDAVAFVKPEYILKHVFTKPNASECV